MPTGYTADLYEGEDQSFEAFALSCARNFGALILMRDEAPDAPIPRFEPSPHHQEEIDKLTERHQKLSDPDTAARMHATAVEDAAAANRKSARLSRERAQRYGAMLGAARSWDPPSPDHAGLKDFMIKQLEESIEHDCRTYAVEVEPDPVEWARQERVRAEQRISRAKERLTEDIRRTRERNDWVDKLRASLAGPDEVDQ